MKCNFSVKQRNLSTFKMKNHFPFVNMYTIIITLQARHGLSNTTIAFDMSSLVSIQLQKSELFLKWQPVRHKISTQFEP